MKTKNKILVNRSLLCRIWERCATHELPEFEDVQELEKLLFEIEFMEAENIKNYSLQAKREELKCLP